MQTGAYDTVKWVTRMLSLPDDYIEAVTLKDLPNILLQRMLNDDPQATLENTTIEVEINRDFYSNCSCHAELRLRVTRPETDKEQAERLKNEQKIKEDKKLREKEARRKRQENERQTYERLKAKFEKPAKRSKS